MRPSMSQEHPMFCCLRALTALDPLPHLQKIAPSALGHVVRPTAYPRGPFPLSPLLRGVHALLGQYKWGQGHSSTPLEQGQSLCVQATSTTAIGFAPSVTLAMRNGAHVVPCAVLGSSSAKRGGSATGRFEVADAALLGGLGLGGQRGRGRDGVAIVCAKPIPVPFTSEPTPALVMEFAQACREAATKAREMHHEAFYGS